MFALKPRKEIAIRIALISVILFNALVITPIPAQAKQKETIKAGRLESRSVREFPTFERPNTRITERDEKPVNASALMSTSTSIQGQQFQPFTATGKEGLTLSQNNWGGNSAQTGDWIVQKSSSSSSNETLATFFSSPLPKPSSVQRNFLGQVSYIVKSEEAGLGSWVSFQLAGVAYNSEGATSGPEHVRFFVDIVSPSGLPITCKPTISVIASDCIQDSVSHVHGFAEAGGYGWPDWNNGGGFASVAVKDITAGQELLVTFYTPINNLNTLSSCPSDGCISSSTSTNGFTLLPINTRTGNYEYYSKDISMPTSAGNLDFTRDYVSAITSLNSTLSPGWTHNLDTRLIFWNQNNPESLQGKVLFKAHTANKYVFTINYDGNAVTFYPEAGLQATLVQNTGTPITYTLKDIGQKTYTFDETGKLMTYADAQGHTWTYSYLPDGKLDQVSADGGKFLNLDYDQGRVQSVSDHTGRSVLYTYNASGDLDTFTDVLGQTWTYEYNDPTLSHYLTRVAAPGNVTVEQQEYYPNSRAWKQYDGEGNLVVELTYNTDGTTTLKDALNHTETHTYNDRGTLTAETNGVGGNIGKYYDPNFRPGVITDSLGNPTNLTWSTNGTNLTQIKDALNNQTNITYGSLNNPTSIIDPLTHETKYFYTNTEFPNLPTRIEYPLSFDGGTTYIGTDYEYYPLSSGPSAGKVKFVTDAAGNKTYYEYNSAGQTTKVTTGFGTPTALDITYVYDSLGRLTDTTDSQGIVTHNEYNAAGQLLKTTNNYVLGRPQNDENKYNLVTEYRYDIRGNQIAVIDTYSVITRMYYDLDNKPVAVVQNLTGQTIETVTPPARGTNPEENIRTDTVYDDAGNVIATIDPVGLLTRTYYDSANRPVTTVQNLTGQTIETTTPPLFNSGYPDQNIRTDTVYDTNGNVIASNDTLGVITRTYYDALNRPFAVVQNLVGQDIAATTPPTRGTTSNIRMDTYYDANGNVIATKDPKDVITRTYYDALNRPFTVIQNLTGQTITNPEPPTAGVDSNIRMDTYYDASGNVIATVDPRGVVTRTYYDSANRPYATAQNLSGQSIYVTTPPVATSGNSDENIRTDIAYDQNGHRDTTTDPLGRVTKYEYNELGQLDKVIGNYVNGGTPQNQLDQRNIVSAYEYDALGRQVKVTDTAGRVTVSAYDDLGRLVVSTQNYDSSHGQNYKDTVSGDQYNLKTFFTYDVRSNQIAVTDTKGIVTRTYYDLLGRAVNVARNFTGVITDPTPPVRGNPPSATSNLRTDTVYLGNGSVDYVLDEMGEQNDYTYDTLGRLITVLDPLSKSTNYGYDANGNRITMTDAENVVTKYEYDALNRLHAVVENYSIEPANVETNVRTEYAYDASGNRLTIRDGNSFFEGVDYRTVFTYDALGRLKTETDAESHQWVYSYDKLGNRVSLRDANIQETIYEYDELNRLTLINYPTGTADISFAYDALGRRVSMTDGLGQTSWTNTNLDQPSLITDPFGTGVSYDYDSLGNRTSLGYGSQSYGYQYNDLNQLEEVTSNQLSVASYGYDAAGRLKTITRANGVDTAYTYFDNGWLQNIVHVAGATTLGSYGYQYYNDGNRSQAIEDVTSPFIPPTPTPTYTPTLTATQTATHTFTPTATAAQTFTPTNTPTATHTPTDTPVLTPVNTASPTGTMTYTPTATATFTPTATNTPTTSNTGWISPTANAAVTSGSGDNDGFQTNSANAYSDNAAFAVDTNSGKNTNTACADTGKDRHVFYTYDLASVPGGSTILGIEVRLDMKVDDTSGAPMSCIELSWDGGTTWTAAKTTTTFTTSEAMYILGNAGDTWGRAWTTGELSNLRVRITNVASNTSRDFSLDWIPVRVSYIPPAMTQTPIPANTNTPTLTPTATSTPKKTPVLPTGTLCASPTPISIETPPIDGPQPDAPEPCDPISTIESPPTSEASANFFVLYKPNANIALLQQGSFVTISYVYDPLQRLTEANYSNGDYYHYTYDAVGNRLTQNSFIGGLSSTTNYVYNNTNRLASVGGVTYLYDANGNLLNDGTNTYTYDSANRLKSLSRPGTSVTYAYNGLGDRLRETVNGVTTTFTMDLNTGLTQALSDGTNHYIYGLGRIAQTAATNTEYFLGDALGSVRQLTNASGAITYSRAYDPYGVVTSTVGTSSTSYGYTGESYGDSTELLYLRSRYYAGNTGRFLTRDTWGGAAYSPMSLNKWNYSESNPVNRTDPTGHYSKELISKNIGMMEFWRGSHPHWGFYALLRNAEDYDSLNIGYVDLMRQYPDVFWSYHGYFYAINCETIMVGSQTLREFYENKILRQNYPGIWWRDTSATYYELPGFDYTRLTSTPGRVFVDGDPISDFPLFHSLSIGVGDYEINLIADVDGNKFLSFNLPKLSGGAMAGIGYTESYLCGWGTPCTVDLSQSEVESAIAGICASGELVIVGGINLSPICHGWSLDTQFSSISTFYIGLEAGMGGGATVAIPLSWFGVAPNPGLGWRWALTNQRNGTTYNDILTQDH